MKTPTQSPKTEHSEMARLRDVVKHWKNFSDTLSKQLGCYKEVGVMLKEVKSLQSRVEELEKAIRRMTPWLGKMIADGGHLRAVKPNDAVEALHHAEELLQSLSTAQKKG